MQVRWLNDEIDNAAALTVSMLADHGVHTASLGTDKARYQPELDALSARCGYCMQDVITLTPCTDQLDAMLQKFDREHSHSDDEVRFVLTGAGVFDIRSRTDAWMRIVVEAGDLIVVPHDRYHRFELTAQKSIHCLRLFKDVAGWAPVYRS